MNARAICSLASTATAVFLTACSATVVKLEEAIPCPLSNSALAERCAEPQLLADGATYADLVASSLADRGHLKTCAAHDELLRQAIAACNAEIAKHNEAIREINRKYAAKP